MTADDESKETALVQSQLTSIDFPEWMQPRHKRAAYLLALGHSKTDVAKEVKITRPALYKWLEREDFAQCVDRLTMTVGLADKAERVRQMQQRANELRELEKGKLGKRHDWLDYAQAIAQETGAYQMQHNPLANLFVKIFGNVEISASDAKALGSGD